MANTFIDKLNGQIRYADTLQRLLAVNIAIFIIVRLVNSISTLFLTPWMEFQTVASWIAVPASAENLLHRPWTLLTYMFFHWDFMHLLFNMLWLYWMGIIFQEYLGNKKLFSTYFLGGLSGALMYILAYNVFPLFSSGLSESFALGASASVLAITVAAATLLPNYPIQLLFFGRVALKWIAAMTILLDLINVSGSNAGGHIAHLGGALFGFVYIRQLKAGKDLASGFNNLMDRIRGQKKHRLRAIKNKQKVNDEIYNTNKKAKQELLDEILDKISKSGYGSLTQEEKEFLFSTSKEE